MVNSLLNARGTIPLRQVRREPDHTSAARGDCRSAPVGLAPRDDRFYTEASALKERGVARAAKRRSPQHPAMIVLRSASSTADAASSSENHWRARWRLSGHFADSSLTASKKTMHFTLRNLPSPSRFS
jgi:hypothetical protein